MTTLSLKIIDMGANNVGALGPAGLDDEKRHQVAQALIAPEYSLPASNRWICIDGRCSPNEMGLVDERLDADPQTAGSIPNTDTAVSYMGDPSTHRPRSEVVAKATTSAIEDGLAVVVHGDEAKRKAGCAANALLREVLSFSSDNIEVLAPSLWRACQNLGLDQWISEDDVYESATNGKAAAANDELWDCTPEEVVDIAIEAGAEYEEYQGAHGEVIDREDHTEGAFAKPLFNQDHSKDRPIQVFSTSAGKYKSEAFRRAGLHGRSEREAALDTMRAKLFNRAAKKMLMSEEAQIGVVSYC